MEGNSNSVEWKEIAILKLLFPSTLLFLEWKEIKWNRMEGNSNAENSLLNMLQVDNEAADFIEGLEFAGRR